MFLYTLIRSLSMYLFIKPGSRIDKAGSENAMYSFPGLDLSKILRWTIPNYLGKSPKLRSNFSAHAAYTRDIEVNMMGCSVRLETQSQATGLEESSTRKYKKYLVFFVSFETLPPQANIIQHYVWC
jgi:hypothetical protein